MAELASDWGFQPFKETAEYPSWDANHGDDSGKRAQKTDKRRQRQLEALVSGVVRLTPAPAGLRQPSGEAHPEAAPQPQATASAGTHASHPTAALGSADQSTQQQQPQVHIRKRRKADLPHDSTVTAAEDSRQAGAADPNEAATAPPQQAPSQKRRSRNKFKPDADVAAHVAGPAQLTVLPGATSNAAEQPAAHSNKKRKAQQAAAASGTAQGISAQSPSEAVPTAACAAPSIQRPGAGAEAPAQPSSRKRGRHEAIEQPEAGPQQNGAQQGPAAASTAAAAATPGLGAPPQLTKSQKRKRQRQRKAQMQEPAQGQHTYPPPAASTAEEELMRHQPLAVVQPSGTARSRGANQQPAAQQRSADAAQPGVKPAGGSKLLDKMRGKLQGGRFRWLNEQLYTSTGNDAFQMMQEQPDLYSQYHEGFRRQAADWPQQPVNAAVNWLKGKPKDFVVADFGCGDAQLAAQAAQRVHSFDLVADQPAVTACNMAAVPLPDASVNAAVFCLALMGTDYGAFLQEAHRVLKPGGWLWMCEVRSRFAGQGPSVGEPPADGAGGGDGTAGGQGGSGAGEWVMLAFKRCLKALGFKLAGSRVMNKMFVVFELRKGKAPPAAAEDLAWPVLKSSVYKKQ